MLAIAMAIGQGMASIPCHADDVELPQVDIPGTRAAEATSPVPVTVIDREAIDRSGAATIDELLLRLPSAGFQGINQNQNGGGFGVSFIDLRNLNFNRTLVLVDGRREVLSGIKTDEAVDLANIPTALISRVEVTPDGSAPRYGADAVAGVVNVILKHDLSGLSVAAGSGISGYGDDRTRDLSMAYGKALDSGNITLAASWMRRDPVVQSSRPWARDPIEAATFAPDGELNLTRGSPASLGGNAVTANGSVGPITGRYDTSLASYLQGGLERVGLDAIGHQQITQAVGTFVELSYADKVSNTRLPPQILGPAGSAKNPDGFVIPADNPYNPYGEAVTLQRVLGEVGDLATRTDSQVFRAVAGFEGRGPADTDWSLSLNHGESRTDYRTANAVDLTRVLQTVSGNPAQCPAAQGCVAGDYFGAGNLSPAAAAYIRYEDSTRSEYLETVAQAMLTRAMNVVPTLPWNASIGAEYRREYGTTIPSAVVLAGDQAGADSGVTAGGYDSREMFFDLNLPLLRDRSMADSLTAGASGRWVSTTQFGSFPAWNLSLSWAPTGDIHLRAAAGTARRVPAITEAYGATTSSPLDVTDPCDSLQGLRANSTVAANCRALGLPTTFRQSSALIQVANGGNPGLKPEYSRNYSVGTVLTPGRVPNFMLSIDYYDILVHAAIDSLSDADPNYIPDQCLLSPGLSSPLCALIRRTPAGPGAGQISLINAPDQNIGAIETDGLDLAATYRYPFDANRTLSVDWQNTVLFDYRVQETPAGAFVQQAGTFPSLVDAGSLTRYKGLLGVSYQSGCWSGDWSVRVIGAARVAGDAAAVPFSRAPALDYNDVGAGFRASKLTLRFGIDNAFNRRPPTLVDGISNTNLNSYDAIGRYFHLSASSQL
jgi:outer membrane receptor protein involved in Fe transport